METRVKDLDGCEARPEQCGGTGYLHRSQVPAATIHNGQNICVRPRPDGHF